MKYSENIFFLELLNFFVFHLLHLPLQCKCIAYFTERHPYLMTSLFSLMTLNYFKTSYVILTKLGEFYLVSLWNVLMFAARGLSLKLFGF